MKIKSQLKKSPFVLIIMGLIGFITGHYIIFGNEVFDFDDYPEAEFAEISFNPQCAVHDSSSKCGKIITVRGDAKRRLVVEYWAHTTLQAPKTTHSEKTQEKVDTVKRVILNSGQLTTQYTKKYEADVEFFRNNPIFMIWVVFIVAMCVMWFVVFLPSLGLIEEMNKHTAFAPYNLSNRVWGYMGFAFVIVLLFHLVILTSSSDTTTMFQQIFLPNWEHRFKSMNVIGFVMLSPVFAGMLYVYRFSNELKPSDNDAIDYLENKLKVFLIVLSIGFSFIMVNTSVLYTAVHELQFIKKITADVGKTPLPTTFIIAYGVIYSIIIAVFYLPAIFKLYNLRSGQLNTIKEGGLLKIDNTVKNVLGEVFKSSVPLVTSIITSILAMVFEG